MSLHWFSFWIISWDMIEMKQSMGVKNVSITCVLSFEHAYAVHQTVTIQALNSDVISKQIYKC